MDHAGARPVWAFLTGPYALFLLVLLLVPFANIAMYSLHPYSPTKVFLPELTFDNYRKIFDLYYARLFGRTLRLGLITTAVCVVLGYPLAYCLARASPRWQAMGLFLLIMPLMVRAVIRLQPDRHHRLIEQSLAAEDDDPAENPDHRADHQRHDQQEQPCGLPSRPRPCEAIGKRIAEHHANCSGDQSEPQCPSKQPSVIEIEDLAVIVEG